MSVIKLVVAVTLLAAVLMAAPTENPSEAPTDATISLDRCLEIEGFTELRAGMTADEVSLALSGTTPQYTRPAEDPEYTEHIYIRDGATSGEYYFVFLYFRVADGELSHGIYRRPVTDASETTKAEE